PFIFQFPAIKGTGAVIGPRASRSGAVKPSRRSCHVLAGRRRPPLYRRPHLRPRAGAAERDSMLAAIRQFAKSWVATVLFGLLIVSFVVFGIGNRTAFQRHMSNAVITAGDREVSPAAYKAEFDRF